MSHPLHVWKTNLPVNSGVGVGVGIEVGVGGGGGGAEAGTAGQEEPADLPSPDAIPERDILFDVLSIGAVVATVALVLFFF